MDVYDLSVDALYYYEKRGLVRPRRNPTNGYRIYSPDDFKRLSIITELKRMGFSLEQIADYLESHSFLATQRLLQDELKEVEATLESYRAAHANILTCINRYTEAMLLADKEEIVIRHIPERNCLLVAEGLVAYDELPYVFAKRMHENGHSSEIMHSTCCYVVDPSTEDNNGFFAPRAIILQFEVGDFDDEYVLEGGLYATCTFKGGFERVGEVYEKLLRYIESEGYEQAGLLLEQCIVGEYESDRRDEYITSLELPVVLKSE